ncbi:MAG: hypothetical protein HYW25_05195 [Candidatus Aenigmarchaeota archaeon]|nr:hypothetical protein [Candidatus Aenigmarchaeota archaeon]
MSLEIFLMIITVILYGTATTLQKYSINKMRRFSLQLLLKNKTWLFSFAVGLLGTIAYLGALRYGTFSFVQTSLSATIVIPILAGFLFFREKMSVIEWLSVASISAGIILYSL